MKVIVLVNYQKELESVSGPETGKRKQVTRKAVVEPTESLRVW